MAERLEIEASRKSPTEEKDWANIGLYKAMTTQAIKEVLGDE